MKLYFNRVCYIEMSTVTAFKNYLPRIHTIMDSDCFNAILVKLSSPYIESNAFMHPTSSINVSRSRYASVWGAF